MLTDSNIMYAKESNGPNGVPLVWVIDGQCLYDISTSQENADMFLLSQEILDVSENYTEHDGITVRFIKDGEFVNDFQTSEYFGSILLSNPQVLSLFDYPYGRYVISPNANFDGEKFIITNVDTSSLMEWHPLQNKNTETP
jgi:hypothetical protein